MPEEVRVEIAGIGLLFRSQDFQIKENKIGELNIKDFIKPGKNDVSIDIEAARPPEYFKEKLLFAAKENWRLYEGRGKYIFEIYETHNYRLEELLDGIVRPEKSNVPNISTQLIKICVVEKDFSKAKVYILPEDSDYNSRVLSLQNLLQIIGHLIIINILHRHQGLFIHSSGVVLNGKGVLFSGISGAGKTTLAKLWQRRNGVTVLSDERIIVRRQKTGYFIYGSPWPGEGQILSHHQAPLEQILFLSRGQQNKLMPLRRKESFRRLLTQCFPLIWDKAGLDFTLKFCQTLVEEVPCFSFAFVADESAPEFIKDKLSNA